MNIVIATPYLPYPTVPHGGGQDLFDLITFLVERHRVRVVSFADAAQAAHAEALRPIVDSLHVIRPAFTITEKMARAGTALQQGRLPRRADAEMRAALFDGWADVLYCAWTEMGRYLADAPPGVVRVLDEVDVRFIVEEAAGHPGAEERRQQELAYCRSANLVLTRSARDLCVLQQALPNLEGLVVPPVAHVGAALSIPPEASQPGRVLFAGAMDRARNQIAARWLVESIWPLVRAEIPEAELRIVGANPPDDIRRLDALPGVTVTGWVDDLLAEFAQACVAVAPQRSEAGTLNKVMDGLAAGRPVVATSVANAGVAAPAEAIRLADTPADFAAAICHLLTDRAEWARQAAAGRAHARHAFDRPGALARLEAALLERVEKLHA